MKKKIVVAPASNNPINLDEMTIDQLVTEYHVPRGIFDTIGTVLPSFLKEGLKKFVLGVPTLDTEKKVMKMKITIAGDKDKPDTIIKLQVSMTPEKPHKIKVSTDGGDTWKELSYTTTTDDEGDEEVVAPNPAKRGRPKKD